MKKTYIIPASLTVQLGTTTNMLQSSLVIDKSGANTISDQSQILTKETSDVNVWDEEW